MAILQAMEPHVLEQTWSPFQSDEGKAGACEKLVLELAQLTYERRIAKILDPSFGRESGVTLDRALEMMVRRMCETTSRYNRPKEQDRDSGQVTYPSNQVPVLRLALPRTKA
ncbi:hypothetical protein E4U09_002864 [Claviceps aff. purpurea]|uniref:Uncharacterized protein n=1 Tax=Claviceps aff. purpurea TaxID=1967640 RepID=A0A9P7QFE4_9HYPO|nr:hypothetical protein E4U09_002864 [Claviceps aff. purpurea]